MENKEINKLVATKIMGWVFKEEYNIPMWVSKENEDERALYQKWNPSTDLNQAKDVIYMMQNKGFYSQFTDLTLDSGQPWYSWSFTDTNPMKHETYKVQAETIARALCLAALKAIEGEVEYE
jgi:Phage ABA sandwich domain